MATVVNPPMPYNGYFVGGCNVGTMLQINGFIPPHANTFAVNFKTGNNDIALHFNPRFNDNLIVLNSLQYNSWGTEQKVSSALQRGRQFELKFLVERDKFMVAIDGRHHCEFVYRLPRESIQKIEVTGDVQATYINESNTYAAPPITNPPVPFTTNINGSCAPGKRLVIYGVMTGNNFSINIQSGFEPFKNVGLHFNPRVSERAIIFNDCTNGGWGPEERCGLPFSPHQSFMIEIVCHPHAYEIRVNGATVANFKHRGIPHRPLASLNTLHITGDVVLQQVVV